MDESRDVKASPPGGTLVDGMRPDARRSVWLGPSLIIAVKLFWFRPIFVSDDPHGRGETTAARRRRLKIETFFKIFLNFLKILFLPPPHPRVIWFVLVLDFFLNEFFLGNFLVQRAAHLHKIWMSTRRISTRFLEKKKFAWIWWFGASRRLCLFTSRGVGGGTGGESAFVFCFSHFWLADAGLFRDTFVCTWRHSWPSEKKNFVGFSKFNSFKFQKISTIFLLVFKI